MSQLSLVFFTVLAQSAVGFFIALGFVQLLARPHEKAMNWAFLSTFVLLGLGAIASITHLGHPLRMFNVAFGLAHLSPLSLEIVGLSLFGGAAATYTGMRLFNILAHLQQLVLLAAMVLGVVFILLIAQVYTLATVPTWNSGWTSFQFLMTAGVIGPMAAVTALRWQQNAVGEQYTKVITNGLSVANIMMMVIAITGYVGYLFWLASLEAHSNPLTMVDGAATVAMVRVFLMMATILTVAIGTIRGSKSKIIPSVAVVLLLLTEIVGRAFFYDIYMSAGAGM